MALNPQYDAIGKGFVQQYYAIFDDPAQRPNLANLYNVETSFMTFEGVQLQGAVKIMEKLNKHNIVCALLKEFTYSATHLSFERTYNVMPQGLGFQKIGRFITSIDSQPMFDGGVLINVLGRLQCDDDPPHSYMQTFVLKTLGDSFFVQHDIFRLCIHDVA